MFSAASKDFETFQVYIITRNHSLIHLTFRLDRHEKALSRLEENSREFRIDPGEKDLVITGQIEEYLDGRRQRFTISTGTFFLDQGTAFQKKVWNLINAIPYGQTRTYGELALQLGSRGYGRAVGRACNANPLALIIPCHRVVSCKGTGGFAGGNNVKQQLLEMEKNRSANKKRADQPKPK